MKDERTEREAAKLRHPANAADYRRGYQHGLAGEWHASACRHQPVCVACGNQAYQAGQTDARRVRRNGQVSRLAQLGMNVIWRVFGIVIGLAGGTAFMATGQNLGWWLV